MCIPRIISLSCVCLLLMFGVARHANSDSILYTGDGSNDGNQGFTLGIEFTPTIDIYITSLGVFAGGGDGPDIGTDHAVGLYTGAGVSLASATVKDNSGFLQDGFRFTAIAPVLLNASNTYVVAAYYPSGFTGDKLEASIFNSNSLINISGHSVAEGGSELVFPDAVTNFGQRLSANILFTPVPVPAALWLFGSGLLGLIGIARRKKTA